MIYPLELFNGHAIIRTETDIILIDTGAPCSINATGQFTFEGTAHQCSTIMMGVTVDVISGLLGMDITTLMGADVLAKYQLVLDYRNLQATFSDQPIEFEGSEVALESLMGIPIIRLSISGNQHRFFLDTGAQYSYVAGELIAAFPPAGEAEDFYPGVGRFQINCHDVELLLGEDRVTARCGNPPPLVRQMLTRGNCKGIIGADLFNNFRVLLDLAGPRMRYVLNERLNGKIH